MGNKPLGAWQRWDGSPLEITLPKASGIHKWTDAERVELRAMRANNASWEDCAKRFGVSQQAARRQTLTLAEQYSNRDRMRNPNVQHAPIEAIADKVVRPGIDKHLVPLCLYMGTRSFSRIHRWWNFTLAAMEQGCEDLTDIVKLSQNPDYSHLCGTTSKVDRAGTIGFFTRLRDNPVVTDNIPMLTEWAEHILPRPYVFRRVPLESFEQNCAPWRLFKVRRKAFRGNIKPVASSACYPFIAHDPKKEGFDLVSKVNKAVPRGLPEEIRADICQDIICAILMGEMKEEDLQGSMKDFIAQGKKMFANKWDFMSLDAPIPGMEGKTYMDGLTGDLNGDWEMRDASESDDEYDFESSEAAY